MSLADTIRAEINAGNLPHHWKTSDLCSNTTLAAQYTASTLNTLPSNHSISLPCLALGNGFSANPADFIFYRVGRSKSYLYALPEHAAMPAATQTRQATSMSTAVAENRNTSDIALRDKDLHKIFEFISHPDKHNWNDQLQAFWNRKTLSHCDTDLSRLKALFYEVVNTQSYIKLDKIAQFWERLGHYEWPSIQPALNDLISFLSSESTSDSNNQDDPWSELFHALKNQPGWGNKTAALFVKNVIRIHRSEIVDIHFLTDGSQLAKNIEGSTIYLPVDAVIIHIFTKYFRHICKPNFSEINQYLQKHYKPEQIILWDDLWLWGFLTQNSQSSRNINWNPGKFWVLQYYSSDQLDPIKIDAMEFIKILHNPG